MALYYKGKLISIYVNSLQILFVIKIREKEVREKEVMSLYDTKKDLVTIASVLPQRYEKYDITELADNYCKALDEKDDYNINLYLSTLLLRFWYVIDKMYQRCKNNGVEREDCFYRLYECINAACHYRAWQNPDKHTNAQACINQVLA